MKLRGGRCYNCGTCNDCLAAQEAEQLPAVGIAGKLLQGIKSTMGRFRLNEDADNENDNPFRAQHVYSSSEEEEQEERGGFWGGGPMVPFHFNFPQNPNDNNNGMDVPAPQNERDMGGSPIQPPSVSLRRQRQPQPQQEQYGDLTERERGGDHYEYPHNHPAPPRSSLFRLRNIVFVIVSAHLIGRYGPVAPPAEADSHSWQAFFTREAETIGRSGKLLCWTVPKYVTHWVATGLLDDLSTAWYQYQQDQKEKTELEAWSTCSLEIPQEWNLEYDNTNPKEMGQHYYLVGQARAIQIATQALDAWKQSSPLLLNFAGSIAVGKLELAKQISLRMFGHCLDKTNPEDLFHGSSSPMMLLQGRDFALPPEDNTNSQDETDTDDSNNKRSFGTTRMQLYENILRHTQHHPNGTVIVLQRPEDMVEGLLASLLQDLTNPSRYASNEEERTSSVHDYGIGESLSSRLHRACSRTVFIVTSTVGSQPIQRFMQRYEGVTDIPLPELDLEIMHELDREFIPIGRSTTQQSGKKKGHYYVDVGSKFHAVAPFFLLQQPVLAQILAQKASQWTPPQESSNSASALRQFSLTKETLGALLDGDRLGYAVAVKRGSRSSPQGLQSVLQFSDKGANILNPVMNVWQASVKRCLRSAQWVKDSGSNDHPKTNLENAVLDYDVETKLGLVLACPWKAIRTTDDSSSFPLVTVNRPHCLELCRLSLHDD